MKQRAIFQNHGRAPLAGNVGLNTLAIHKLNDRLFTVLQTGRFDSRVAETGTERQFPEWESCPSGQSMPERRVSGHMQPDLTK